MNVRRMLSVTLLLMVWAGSLCGATLYPVDGEAAPGTLRGISPQGKVDWLDASGSARSIEASEVERIVLGGESPDGTTGWLGLAGGMRLAGEVQPGAGKELIWKNRQVGTVRVAFEDVRVYLPALAGRTWPEASALLADLEAGVRESDVAYLANGDVIEGVVEGISGEGVKFNSRVGDIQVSNVNLKGVTFSRTLKPHTQPRDLFAMLDLVDGSRVSGKATASQGRVKVETSAGLVMEIAQDALSSIRFENNDLVWLSSLDPVFVRETPYFDKVWSWQRDRSVWGKPLTIGSRSYDRGIGMHSHCQLDFALDGNYRTFLTDLGVDSETAGAGDCIAAVYADGKAITRGMRLTGKTGALTLRLDVSGVKRLTILVDFGEGRDAGDHVTWGNARLVKK